MGNHSASDSKSAAKANVDDGLLDVVIIRNTKGFRMGDKLFSMRSDSNVITERDKMIYAISYPITSS
ncbi:MAG: hypothetical protein M3162_05545 [Thermoproteota archaeon]|nr:hypothetical protein [Thermoproteota archaeon]